MALPSEYSQRLLNEYDFLTLLEKLLPKILGAQIISGPRVGPGRPDFLAVWTKDDREAIVEAKSVTPNTRTRLEHVVQQLQGYADFYQRDNPRKPRPELMLAVPGILTPQHLDFLHVAGIQRVIDGPEISLAAGDDVLPGIIATGADTRPQDVQSATRRLIEQLLNVNAGKKDWAIYQTLCGEILSFLLCPPLFQPLSESANDSRINRRDFVFPNYATTGFWDYMRSYYQAHFVVVDAKNYVGNVKKTAVLQIANYLNAHGAGLFGMIVSRTGGDRSAELTRREQWIVHRKMIVLLNDDDMRQMLSLQAADSDPAELIRQKIEDFRLSF